MTFLRNHQTLTLFCVTVLIMITVSTPAFATSNNTFLDIARECHNYIATNNFYYSQGVTLPLDREGNNRVDCSSFVSWCIYVYTDGEFDECKTSKWYLDVAEDLATGQEPDLAEFTSSWEVITNHNDFASGDIMCYASHVHIYAGQNIDGEHLVYNAGSNKAINEEISNISESYFYKAQYALRLP